MSQRVPGIIPFGFFLKLSLPFAAHLQFISNPQFLNILFHSKEGKITAVYSLFPKILKSIWYVISPQRKVTNQIGHR